MKVWVVAGIVGLTLAFGAAVGVAGMFVAGSGSGSLSVGDPVEVPAEPTATPYEKRLTGTEAAALVQTGANNAWRKAWAECLNSPSCTGDWKGTLFTSEDCTAAEFNDHTHDWIVKCTDWVENTLSGLRQNQGVSTYRVSDETSDYYEVGN